MNARAQVHGSCLVLALLAAACIEPAKPMATAGDDDAGTEHDAGAPVCASLPDGFACGPGRHCIAQSCRQNVCGDGFVGDGEACDDGNQSVDDDCTPSCRVIPAVCGDGKVSGHEQCDDGNRNDEDGCTNLCAAQLVADAGDGPSVTASCPRLAMPIQITPYAGTDPRYQGRVFVVDATFAQTPPYARWQWNEAQAEVLLGPPLHAVVTCTRGTPGPVALQLVAAQPSCALFALEIVLECGPPWVPPVRSVDAGMDAASSGSGGAGGLGSSDAGTTDTGAAGTGGTGGGSADAGGDGGGSSDGPIPGLSEACGTCVIANCTEETYGIDIAGRCFMGAVGANYTDKCTDAFVCSTVSPDACAQNNIVGPIGCYCGEGVDPAACASGSMVSGECIPEWEAATGCMPGDSMCVTERFADLEQARPAVYAYFALTCQLELCADACF